MTRLVGELTARAGGKEYQLRLSMRGLARLQDEYGAQLEPLMGIKEGELPHFGVLLRVIEVALERHHPDAEADLADDILSENPSVAIELVKATFPDAEEPARGKKKAANR